MRARTHIRTIGQILRVIGRCPSSLARSPSLLRRSPAPLACFLRSVCFDGACVPRRFDSRRHDRPSFLSPLLHTAQFIFDLFEDDDYHKVDVEVKVESHDEDKRTATSYVW